MSGIFLYAFCDRETSLCGSVVERFLGKEKVPSSILGRGFMYLRIKKDRYLWNAARRDNRYLNLLFVSVAWYSMCTNSRKCMMR